jgi:hypothetical protein
LYIFCFRAPKKKLLKFLSSVEEEARNNDDDLIELLAEDTGIKPTVVEVGVSADSGGAGPNSSESSGNSVV